jgi:hypothetical protein
MLHIIYIYDFLELSVAKVWGLFVETSGLISHLSITEMLLCIILFLSSFFTDVTLSIHIYIYIFFLIKIDLEVDRQCHVNKEGPKKNVLHISF